MKKLVKAVIINFQSHKKSIINFADFTVIVGPTDSGKSAIIRAIKWCLYNTPSGIEFMRYGEKFVEVILYFNDGTTITRHKGDKDFYELMNATGEVIHLEAFGVGSVEEVVRFHGMREVDFLGEKQALNVCDQLSQPFFIAESSIERANIIGRIGNTDAPDEAIQEVASEIKAGKADEKRLKALLKEKDDKLVQYADLPRMEYDLIDAKKLKVEIEKIIATSTRIKTAKSTLSKLLNEKSRLEAIMVAEQDINDVFNIIENLTSMTQHLNQVHLKGSLIKDTCCQRSILENTINQAPLEEVEECIDNLNKALEQVKSITTVKAGQNRLLTEFIKKEQIEQLIAGESDIMEAFNEIEFCQMKLTDIVNSKNKVTSLTAIIERKNKGEKVIDGLESEYQDSRQAYKNALLENPQCPFCASDIDTQKL